MFISLFLLESKEIISLQNEEISLTMLLIYLSMIFGYLLLIFINYIQIIITDKLKNSRGLSWDYCLANFTYNIFVFIQCLFILDKIHMLIFMFVIHQIIPSYFMLRKIEKHKNKLDQKEKYNRIIAGFSFFLIIVFVSVKILIHFQLVKEIVNSYNEKLSELMFILKNITQILFTYKVRSCVGIYYKDK